MLSKTYEFLIYGAVSLILTLIYFACFNVAKSGYGYTGHGGYASGRGASYWYNRNFDENRYPSNRENSVDGNRFSQRGLSGGK